MEMLSLYFPFLFVRTEAPVPQRISQDSVARGVRVGVLDCCSVVWRGRGLVFWWFQVVMVVLGWLWVVAVWADLGCGGRDGV